MRLRAKAGQGLPLRVKACLETMSEEEPFCLIRWSPAGWSFDEGRAQNRVDSFMETLNLKRDFIVA